MMRTLWAGFCVLGWAILAVWAADWQPKVDAETQRQTAVQSLEAWRAVLEAAGRHLGLTLAVFAAGGLLVGGLGFAARREDRWPRWVLTPAAALGVAAAAGFWSAVDGAPVLPWALLHAAVGAWGALTGALLLGGRTGRTVGEVLLILPWVGAAVLAIRMTPAIMATEPLPVESVDLTAAAKRDLSERLQAPRVIDAEQQLKELRLSETEVNQLLAMGAEANGNRMTLRAILEPGHAYLRGSRRAGDDDAAAYHTAAVGLDVAVLDGRVDLAIRSLRIGDQVLPPWLLAAAMPDLLTALRSEPRVRELLEATERLRITDGEVAVRVRGDLLADDFLSRLTGEAGAELTAAAAGYARHLLEVSRTQPAARRDLTALLAALFDRATERSREGGDPVFENRAALVALGVVAGHLDVQRLTGTLIEASDAQAEARRLAGTVRIRGRNDWARHLAISAMLTVRGNEALSDTVGRLKEEIDSAAGGSGFSFADLLADRAGTRLAARATADAEQARRLQDLLAENDDPAAFFPPADDLPEGIDEAALQAEYGGKGGEEYQRVMDKIESRLDDVPALR